MGKAKLWIGVFLSALCLAGCGDQVTSGDRQNAAADGNMAAGAQETKETQGEAQETAEYVDVSTSVTELESGFSTISFEGDDQFEAFLNQGGASSDRDVLQFLTGTMLGSKGNFGEFESTEWSVVFDQTALTAEYYHREDYGKSYAFTLFNS